METQTILTDVNPEERMDAIYDKLNKLGISSNPDLSRVSELYLSSTKRTEQEL
jgi:hypothetical protein